MQFDKLDEFGKHNELMNLTDEFEESDEEDEFQHLRECYFINCNAGLVRTQLSPRNWVLSCFEIHTTAHTV